MGPFDIQALILIVTVIVAGLASLRVGYGNAYKKTAEERKDRIEALEEEKALLRKQMDTEREQQRDLRHGLKEEIGNYKLQLEAERLKTDLSGVLERVGSGFEGLNDRIDRMDERVAEAHAGLLNGLNDLATKMQAIADKITS